MRKIKKINGYLVVRFNDREKRLNEGTGLGSFGVIDAELYSGILDIDRDLMEFDGADTLEEAIDQARGLEAEQDVDEPQVKITIVKETDTDSAEEEIDPVSLFDAEKATLKAVNENCTVPGLGDLITSQRLYGYTRALTDLGIVEIGDERFQVDAALPTECTALMMALDALKDFKQFKSCLKEIEYYANESSEKTRDYEHDRANIEHRAASTPSYMPFSPLNKRAERERLKREKRSKTGFLNPPTACSVPPIELYELGEKLLFNCSGNDCIRYRDIFQMCYEADIQLSRLIGWTRRVVERELNKQYRELEKMYQFSEEIRDYRNGVE